MARQPFSSSISDTFDPYGAFRSMPVRSTLPTAYYFLRNILIAGALAGGIVALYRNDVFRDLARRAGQEERYLSYEKFFLGSPGWGTPRSMEPVLAGAAVAQPLEASAAATPTADVAPTATQALAAPAPIAETATTVAQPSQPVAAAAPIAQPAPSPATKPAAPADPLAPVSLDSLPLLGGSRGRASAPVSVAALPAAAPPPRAAAPVSHAPPPAPASRAVASTSGSKTKAIAVSLDEEPSASPARAPKAKPAPEPPPEPPPAPVAAKPEPKGPKTSDARPSDNPLLGAIRSAVRARPPKDGVPQ